MLLRLLNQLRLGLSSRRSHSDERDRLLAEARRLGETGAYVELASRMDSWLGDHADDPDALQFAGLAQLSLGNFEAALSLLQRAARVRPDAPVIHTNLAEALRRLGRVTEAQGHLEQAIALAPSLAPAHLNLAVVLAERSQRGAAIESARRAVALDPDSARGRLLLGAMLLTKSQAEEALPHLEHASRLEPRNPSVLYQLERSRRILCDWSGWPKDGCGIVEYGLTMPGDSGAVGFPPFFAYEYPVSNELRLRCAQNYADQFLRSAVSATAIQRKPNDQRDRLRIGYLSSDFHDHPTMHLAAGLFPRHDRQRFEVWAYSIGASDGSSYRQRLQRDVEHFVDVSETSSRDLLGRISADGIHILIDMKGFTFGARPDVLAGRAAPVQVQFLGYPGTMGRGLVDYLVSDRIVTPPGSECWYGEQLALLPGSYQINDCDQAIGPTPSRQECGLPAAAFVFCCFNAMYKFDPDTFAVWMRLLRQVPDSVLWLLAGKNPGAIERLRLSAQRAGVDPERLIFAPFMPKAAHLGRLANADLVLDTRHVNAHTGASDALWAGVPVLTVCGDSFPSRVASSLLHAVGLPELSVDALEEYERTALGLATNPATLARLRARLRENRAHCSLFDTGRWVKGLERAYEIMWARFCSQGDAGAFSVIEVSASSASPE